MKDLILLNNGTILVVEALKEDKYSQGYINVAVPVLPFKYIECITIDESTEVHEDELPELTDDEYTLWYSHSFIEDGVRMGYEVIR